jgi:hypothetical protein
MDAFYAFCVWWRCFRPHKKETRKFSGTKKTRKFSGKKETREFLEVRARKRSLNPSTTSSGTAEIDVTSETSYSHSNSDLSPVVGTKLVVPACRWANSCLTVTVTVTVTAYLFQQRILQGN